MATTPGVRRARDVELEPLAGLYRRSGFNPRLAAVGAFARSALGGEVFVAERDGAVVGASGCARFGATGWVGGVAVVPEARRAGLGQALTEAALEWLRERGTTTILLYATEMGRPVYERLGFVAEGACVTLRGSWPRGRPPDGVRPARPADLDAALDLDRQATAEDRSPLLTSLWPGSPPNGGLGAAPTEQPRDPAGPAPAVEAGGPAGSALVVERGGEVRGYHLSSSPWRPGGATIAADPDSGLALIEAMGARLDGGAELSLTVPEANAAAVHALRERGQTERSRATRMRLGPPLPWRPGAVFSIFNLFWG